MNIWMITPNWIAWCLLVIASLSLLGLTIYFWSRPNQRHNHVSIVSWIAITVAMCAIVCVFTRNPSSCDSTNLITVLGVMVTLLVGWQIFGLININRIEDRIRETDVRMHENLGEICGEISASQAGVNDMAHIALLFTIHSLIHYSQIGDFEQCEREINALVDDDTQVISTQEDRLRDMYHRMTGRIAHIERISNFDRLEDYIDRLFTNPNNTQPT